MYAPCMAALNGAETTAKVGPLVLAWDAYTPNRPYLEEGRKRKGKKEKEGQKDERLFKQ